ncbi:MAG TPA: carboxypeptidase-like regulatory domain-containing protein, partial [Pseudomonadota bacterium]|nr:carboxypeptidase-like regulatory domain-containing protein [Pseudomonadota bacterium]
MKKQKQWKQLRRGLAKVTLVSLPALGVMLTPPAAYAVGEQDGRISGVVTEKQTGVAMPGVRVRLTGKNLIGGARNTATADDGSYEFIALPPGPYEVELTIEGLQVKPLRRKIVVRQGETFPLNIPWSPEEAKQELKVIYEERKMTKPDSTQTGTVLTADQQARVATARSYQSIAQQVAGVTGGANPNIKGAMNAHNRYMVDGLDITDPVTNTFSANINFDS